MNTTLLKIVTLLVVPVAIFGGDFFATTELSVGEISDRYFGDVLIIPAGYAFSIWGLIYLGVLALAVVQALPQQGGSRHLAAARLPLIANMGCNFAWIVAWQSLQFEVATVILLAQLATGIWLYCALGIPDEPAESRLMRWVRWPISVYVGWLTLATVLGISSLLAYWEWGAWGLSNATWAAIMAVVSAAVGLFVTLQWRDPVYAAVFVWAFVAVALRPDQAGGVAVTASVLAVVFVVVIVGWVFLRDRWS